MLKNTNASDTKVANVQSLKSEVEYRTKLQNICNKIYAASNMDEILIDLKNEITDLFEAERLTVYVVDGKKRELVSRFKSGHEISEIRVPISSSSIAGYSVFKQKLINIKNVYDDKELAAIDPALKFDKSWDQKTGFKTTQVLVVPIIFKKYLLGAVQLINRVAGSSFTKMDEESVTELAKILSIALYNQKRVARARINKFSYLIENHILTQKELDKAIADARKRKEPVENTLVKDLKIEKKEVGKSYSKYYNIPFIEYNSKTAIPVRKVCIK